MAGLVTKETDRSVDAFINSIPNERKREDSRKLVDLIREITGEEPKIWGNEQAPDFIIGFGKYTYRRKGGKEDFEWFNTGIAPRQSKITVYIKTDLSQREAFLKEMGKCTWGRGCLYINKLDDVNVDMLKTLIAESD